MGRRKFGKNAENVRHFKLVARSQNDGAADDPDATPLVLEPFVPPGETRRTGLTEAELLELPPSLQELGPDVFGQGERKCSEELDEPFIEEEDDEVADLDGDCYFPKDGYNYEQHLKRVSGVGKTGGVVGVVMEAPKKHDCVPRAEKEICIQAPENDDEAEVMRALELAEEYDELDEEDLEVLGAAGAATDLDVMMWGPTIHEQKAIPDMEALRAAYKAQMSLAAAEAPGGDDDEECEGVVDEEDFEAFMANEYADEEIGACSDEEIEGHLGIEDAEEAVDEYIQEQQEEAKLLNSWNEPIAGKYDNVPRVIEETRAIIAKHYTSRYEDEEDTSSGEEDTDSSAKWDCETILSTLSNVSNRPGKIGKIKILGKQKEKKEALPSLAEGAEQEDAEDSEDEGSVIELPDVITERKQGETAEEKKARKASVKEMRRVCRKMKKESKEMYKNEAARLPGQKGGCDVKAKQRYQRL